MIEIVSGMWLCLTGTAEAKQSRLFARSCFRIKETSCGKTDWWKQQTRAQRKQALANSFVLSGTRRM